jgi:hypothetical protein
MILKTPEGPDSGPSGVFMAVGDFFYSLFINLSYILFASL